MAQAHGLNRGSVDHLQRKFFAALARALRERDEADGRSRQRGDKPPLSPKSVRNVHGILHKALQQAVTIGYIRFNPADAATMPRIDHKEIQPLSETQISDFLEAIEGHKHEILYAVALFTGLRESEILGLPSACFHALRHTFAVSSICAGDDIKTIQGNLGHATASFTLDVYGHFTEDMKKESSQRMEHFIESISNL